MSTEYENEAWGETIISENYELRSYLAPGTEVES